MTLNIALFAWSCWATGVLSVILGSFVYLKQRHQKIAIVFFWMCQAIALWSISLGSEVVSSEASRALWWSRVMHFGVIFIAPTFLHFCVDLLKLRRTKVLVSAYFFAAPLVLLSFTNLLVPSVGSKAYFQFYTNPGIGYPFLLAHFFVFSGLGIFLLIKGLKNNPDVRAVNQIRYVLTASLFGFIGGSATYLPVFNLPVPSFTMVFVCAYTFLVAYAIFKHKLLDIDVIIKKTLVFAGLFAAIYGVFVLVSSLGQRIFENLFGFNQTLAVIPTVIVLIFIHEPLKKFLIHVTDRFLFQKKYNPAALLHAFAREVVAEYNLNQITRMTVRKLSEILRVGSCAIFVPDKGKDKFILKDSAGLKDQNIFFNKESGGLYLELAKSGGVVLYRENPPLPRSLLEDLRKADARIAFAITGHNETIGILTLGSKRSDEDYTKEDVELLKSLCDALGLAINTAFVFEDTVQKEKLITVGTMVAGIRHDISNPVYLADLAIQEFLMDKEEGRHARIPPAEFSSRVYHLINHCRNTFKKVVAISAKFAEIAKPKSNTGFLPAKLSGIVENYLSVFEHELETKKIRLQKEISTDDPEIPCDEDYIEQVLFNLIRNAIYAIEEAKRPEGLLRVKLYPKEDKVTIEIADNGNGIPEDKLQKIFDSFYTTKPEGVGTGLGLAIVQELVQRSNGVIRVESEYGKGATFILDFKVG